MHLCIRIKAITLVTKGLYNKQKPQVKFGLCISTVF